MRNWFHVNPRSGVPIYVQLTEQIKTAVAGGVLNPGDQLPSVRELAVRLVINPNTVARAYGELEREGLLSVEQGRGTFISGGRPLLDQAARASRLAGLIDRVLVEAYHLQLSPAQVRTAWDERFSAWQEKLREPHEKGEEQP